MSRKRGLGKGLDALIPGGGGFSGREGELNRIPVDSIRPNSRQPRAYFDPDELSTLADSIREHGVLQPLVVSPDQSGGGYELIAGERRWQAAKLAGLEYVPALVREVDERTRLELALIENLQRADLNPLETAEGYRQLAQDFELTHEQIATRVGKSRTAISNTLRLLELAPDLRNALQQRQIREGHARALLGLKHHAAQSAALQTVVENDLNVRQTEALVRRLSGQRTTSRPQSERTPEEVDLEARLAGELGTRVQLSRSARGGRLVIRFYSDEELNALVERLLGESLSG
jgi:ParB family chromosome partitioning protein